MNSRRVVLAMFATALISANSFAAEVQKWEYKAAVGSGGTGHVLEEMNRFLNQMGQEGWELVATREYEGNITLFFKRPLAKAVANADTKR